MDLRRLDPEDRRGSFSCGDSDLDEFYQKDSIEGGLQLLSVTYALEEEGKTIAFFSLSNDSIKREDIPKSAFKRLGRIIPHEKRYSSMPAVKIGRLGTTCSNQRAGYGTIILDFLKASFTIGNKTGCRFLVVDAYNKESVTGFYSKNGFEFLTGNDEKASTRIMYFDLIKFRE